MSVGDPALQQQVHALYSDHHGWLKGWLLKKLGCSHNAADLTHDTFVRAMTSAQIGKLIEPRAFLMTLAKRTLFSFWRRREIEQAYLDALATLPEATISSAEDLALVHEALVLVDALLDGLPIKVRQVFLLHRLEDMTHAEIAKEMGISVATVERYMKRAFTHCFLAQYEPVNS